MAGAFIRATIKTAPDLGILTYRNGLNYLLGKDANIVCGKGKIPIPPPRAGVHLEVFIMEIVLVVFILTWGFSVRRIYLQVGENNWALLAFSTLGVLALL